MLKSSSRQELIGAVHAVAQGAAALSPCISRRVVERVRGIDSEAQQWACDLVTSLTAREHEVLALLRSGKSNAEISGELLLTEAMIKGYVTAILLKLNSRNRVKATLLVFQSGMLM